MSQWKLSDDEKLISLAHQNLSVEEIKEYFSDFSDGSIAIRLNVLKKQKKLSADFKIRMKNWDEEKLIEYARQNLSGTEIAQKYPGLSVPTITGRLYCLRREGKLPKDYNILLVTKSIQYDNNVDGLLENNEETISIITEQQFSNSDIQSHDKKSMDSEKIRIQIKPIDKHHLGTTIATNKNITGNKKQKVSIDESPRISRPRYTITECPTNAKEQKISFLDLLTKNIDLYEGPNKEIQQYCPKFFELLSNILNDKFVDWYTKIMISAALGYFVLEEDVIPDTEENGYIDDLYLVTFVLNEIRNNQSREIIIRNWNGEEDIISLIDEMFIETGNIVGPLSIKILQKVGLSRFSQASLEEYSGEYPKRSARLAHEKRELLGLLAYLVQKIDNVKVQPSFGKIKEYIEKNGNFDEVHRLIELSKLYHKIEVESLDKPEDFEKMLEQRMREARLNSLKLKKI
jgi:uncharacterized membrane protein YkvA (DUF1232 family)